MSFQVDWTVPSCLTMLSSHDDVLSGLERGNLDSLAIRGNAAGEKELLIKERVLALQLESSEKQKHDS